MRAGNPEEAVASTAALIVVGGCVKSSLKTADTSTCMGWCTAFQHTVKICDALHPLSAPFLNACLDLLKNICFVLIILRPGTTTIIGSKSKLNAEPQYQDIESSQWNHINLAKNMILSQHSLVKPSLGLVQHSLD